MGSYGLGGWRVLVDFQVYQRRTCFYPSVHLRERPEKAVEEWLRLCRRKAVKSNGIGFVDEVASPSDDDISHIRDWEEFPMIQI